MFSRFFGAASPAQKESAFGPTRSVGRAATQGMASEPAVNGSSKATVLENPRNSLTLDLVFMCDCTASMGEYIADAQENICSIAERVANGCECQSDVDVRFALVCYRDHPPQDETYVTRVFPFTSNVACMKEYVDTMHAEGGGDGPEAVTAALDEALRLPWRPAATKVGVLIADAPPHGLEPCGDEFPEGDPFGRDPLALAREMCKNEITCYTVGCEPALGCYQFARDFMCTLAELTGGQAVALSSATLLADVIVNGSAEELSLTLLQREVEREIAAVQEGAREASESIDDTECVKRASQNLQSRNVRSQQMRTDGVMKNAHHSIWHTSEEVTLSSAKSALCEASRLDPDIRSESRSAGLLHVASRRSACSSAPRPMRAICERRVSRESALGAAAPAGMLPHPFRSERIVLECEAHAGPVGEETYSAPASSTMNFLTEDVISEAQVARMHKRACTRAS